MRQVQIRELMAEGGLTIGLLQLSALHGVSTTRILHATESTYSTTELDAFESAFPHVRHDDGRSHLLHLKSTKPVMTNGEFG